MSDDPSVSQQAQGSYIAQAAQGGTATVNVVLPPTPVQEQNRVRFLARLRYQYGELWEQSLQGAALLTLGLNEKPDAVLHHTGPLFLSGQRQERPLPPGTSIAEVYEEAGHELLILGEPGAGKSTLLLELARVLVGHAERDAGHPLPVILPLSSWAVKQQPLEEWLPAQLSLLYDISLQLSLVWVNDNQVLPLLDGLDEVPQQVRRGCIEAIIAYRKEHLVPLVVCSRRAEYEEIERPQRLVLHCAVVIEPLSREQVETHLDQAGQSLAAVRTVLRANPVLEELATTPLMLSVVTQAYANAPVQDLPQHGSANVQQQQIFVAYIERMIERKGNRMLYPLEPTKAWLGWLARQMRVHNQTVFYIERMQPDWLENRRTRQFHSHVVNGFIFGLIGACCPGPLSGLALAQVLHSESFPIFTLFCGLLSGLLFGLFNGLLSTTEAVRGQNGKIHWSWKRIWERSARAVVNGWLVGLLVGLPDGVLLVQETGTGGFGYIAVLAALLWLIGGLIFLLIDVFLDIQAGEIRPAETFAWSWRAMGRNLLKFVGLGVLGSLLIGLLIGGVNGVYEWMFGAQTGMKVLLDGLALTWTFMQNFASFVIVIVGLLGMVAGGWSSDVIDVGDLTTPNQGIRRSARSSLLVGSVGMTLGGVIAGLLGGINAGQMQNLMQLLGTGLILGLLIGLVSGLRVGGIACIQHMVLRWLLREANALPWHAQSFLDDATARILLRRIRGSYSFVHRLLLDYFADLHTEASSVPAATQPTQPPPT